VSDDELDDLRVFRTILDPIWDRISERKRPKRRIGGNWDWDSQGGDKGRILVVE
jgi:hypothetical protein